MTPTRYPFKTDMMSTDEAYDLFDEVSRRRMGISGAEFLRLWDAGKWDSLNLDGIPGLLEVRGFLALAR